MKNNLLIKSIILWLRRMKQISVAEKIRFEGRIWINIDQMSKNDSLGEVRYNKFSPSKLIISVTFL